MQRFQWTTEHTVFEPEFDAEHRELFRLSQELSHALEAEAASTAIADVVRRLSAEVHAHFAHEERLMLAAGYSAYRWHKGEHEGASRRIAELAARPGELLEYLDAWFHNHTPTADRMMAASLRNSNRARSAHELS